MERVNSIGKWTGKGIDFITNRAYRFLVLQKLGFFDSIEDEKYLKMLYRAKLGKKLNLENPKTFNEKLQWLKLYDRNPEYIKMVDKYTVKEYVAEKIGGEYIIPTLKIWNHCNEIDFDALPERFVLKCTHDSGGIVLCKDRETFQYDKEMQKLSKHLKNNYYLYAREWPYKYVRPRIIAEKYMISEKGSLNDYKLMCFNGVVKCILVGTNRYSKEGLNITFFDPFWNRLPFKRDCPQDERPIAKPVTLDKMILFAEKLAVDIPFVRVDFYEINGKLYFGEMTFFPGGGTKRFIPDGWDDELGSWIKLPDTKCCMI